MKSNISVGVSSTKLVTSTKLMQNGTKNTHQAPINVPQSMIPIIPYTDDELDAEWAQYCLVLNKTNHLIMKKNQEKKRIKKHEKEIMINLEKHVRKLSQRVRFQLEHNALDTFGDISDDISSDSYHSESMDVSE